MVEYYLEIREERTKANEFRPLEIFRKYVTDITQAEADYDSYEMLIPNHKAVFVEMNHSKTGKDKPCISRPIVNGKVV